MSETRSQTQRTALGNLQAALEEFRRATHEDNRLFRTEVREMISEATAMWLQQANHAFEVDGTVTGTDTDVLKVSHVSYATAICSDQSMYLQSKPDEAGKVHVDPSSTNIFIRRTAPEEIVQSSATMDVRKLEFSTEVKSGVIPFTLPISIDFAFMRPPAMPPETKRMWEDLLRVAKRIIDVVAEVAKDSKIRNELKLELADVACVQTVEIDKVSERVSSCQHFTASGWAQSQMYAELLAVAYGIIMGTNETVVALTKQFDVVTISRNEARHHQPPSGIVADSSIKIFREGKGPDLETLHPGEHASLSALHHKSHIAITQHTELGAIQNFIELVDGDIRKAIMHLQCGCWSVAWKGERNMQALYASQLVDLNTAHRLLMEFSPCGFAFELSEIIELEAKSTLNLPEESSTLFAVHGENHLRASRHHDFQMHQNEGCVIGQLGAFSSALSVPMLRMDVDVQPLNYISEGDRKQGVDMKSDVMKPLGEKGDEATSAGEVLLAMSTLTVIPFRDNELGRVKLGGAEHCLGLELQFLSCYYRVVWATARSCLLFFVYDRGRNWRRLKYFEIQVNETFLEINGAYSWAKVVRDIDCGELFCGGLFYAIRDGDWDSALLKGATAILDDLKKFYPSTDVVETVNELSSSIQRVMAGTSGILYNLFGKTTYVKLKTSSKPVTATQLASFLQRSTVLSCNICWFSRPRPPEFKLVFSKPCGQGSIIVQFLLIKYMILFDAYGISGGIVGQLLIDLLLIHSTLSEDVGIYVHNMATTVSGLETEVVNRCLETYLRCLTSGRPKQWSKWHPLAEFWYNTTFHSATPMTPYEAVYGQPPPQHLPYLPGGSKVAVVDRGLQDRESMLLILKFHLLRAQHRMQLMADTHSSSYAWVRLIALLPYLPILGARLPRRGDLIQIMDAAEGWLELLLKMKCSSCCFKGMKMQAGKLN